MYSIQPVNVAVFKEHVAHLLEANHSEVIQEAYPLNVNWRGYQSLEDLGMLLPLCLFKEDELIGYCIVIQVSSLHSRDYLSAVVDTIYISPEYRGYKPFKLLLNEVEKQVKAGGATSLAIHSHKNHPINRLLEKNNYSTMETIYKKGL